MMSDPFQVSLDNVFKKVALVIEDPCGVMYLTRLTAADAYRLAGRLRAHAKLLDRDGDPLRDRSAFDSSGCGEGGLNRERGRALLR